MDQYQYLLLMGLCLVLTAPLELVFGARVWRSPRRLALAIAPIVIVYGIWDVIAIQRGVWDYSERFTTGILLPLAMPLEELVFFVVIPICGLLTYEAVGIVLGHLERFRARRSGDREQAS